MSETHDPDTGTTVVVVVPPSPEAEGGSGEGGEIQDGAEVVAVEEVADAAVQIAEIEANRDITVEAIRADADVERAAQFSSEELTQCHLRIAELEGENTALRTELSLLTQPPPEPPLSPPEPPPEATETAAHVADPDVQEKTEEPPAPKKKYHKWT